MNSDHSGHTQSQEYYQNRMATLGSTNAGGSTKSGGSTASGGPNKSGVYTILGGKTILGATSVPGPMASKSSSNQVGCLYL